jgi:hypothetical protein
MGEGCGHLEDDMCMYLNDNARNFAALGSHRLIDKAEAYEILKRAEDNGLIHEINQADGFDEANAICNCCSCSCYSLRIGAYFRTPTPSAPTMWPRWTGTSAWPADSAWKTAR